jgi:hypothetical protein
MKMTAYGDLGSNGILNLGSLNVGSMHIGVGNVFTLWLVGHDSASRIASRQMLWIPTIENQDFPDHELHRDEFMIYWKQLAFRKI